MKNSTLKSMHACFAVLIFSVFCLFSFASESFAAPNWIKISYGRPTLEIVGKDISKPGYLALRVPVCHVNQSRNGDIITAIFDKKLKLTYLMDRYLPLNSRNECTAQVQSSNVSRVHLYPGQKHIITYLVPVKHKGKITNNWRWLNEKILSDYRNGKMNDIFQKRKYSYEYQIKRDK